MAGVRLLVGLKIVVPEGQREGSPAALREVAETQGRTERIHRDIILAGSGRRDDQRLCPLPDLE
jgi:hypothetical protein